MREEQTNALYLPLTSTVVFKRKYGMLHLPLDFDKNLTIYALKGSRAYVSAIAHDELETIKQMAPNNKFRINEPPNFQKQLANGHLEKSLATTTLNFEVGGNTYAENFVLMKKLKGTIKWLHFTRKKNLVNDTTHVLIQFPYLTMQIKTPSEKSAKPQAVLIDDALTIHQGKQKQSRLSLTISDNVTQQVL